MGARDAQRYRCATENSVEVKTIAMWSGLEAVITYALSYMCRVTFLVEAFKVHQFNAGGDR